MKIQNRNNQNFLKKCFNSPYLNIIQVFGLFCFKCVNGYFYLSTLEFLYFPIKGKINKLYNYKLKDKF